MAANSNLTLTSLDFDTLKNNLITFLKSQTTFKDYNFTGSNMNVLLDVMSYNTFLNAFYLNMVASEMFLDSAQKLDSVISHAKELNYLPRSNRSPVATISFTLNTADNSNNNTITNPLVIPKGTIFSGLNANGGFTYVTNEETSYLSTNTVYTISNLQIYEGSYVQDTFVVDYSNPSQIFTLSNPSIDTTSLTVTVNENGTNAVYTYAENLFGLSNTSNVYFLQATANQQYQILFGDNVFGYNPLNGDIIYAKYRTTFGSDGNGITSFMIDQDLGAINGGVGVPSVITTVSPSVGGANAETIESIRFNAPRYFQTQGRCVTASDYKSTILQNFPEVEHVNVFSLETSNNVVEFGTVFVSMSTYTGNILTSNRKQNIQSFVNNLSPIGINVQIVDPDYLYITLNSTVHVNFSNTISTPATIISEVISTINDYNVSNLQDFNTAFRMSRLENQINNADVGILSNETKAQLYKIFSPNLNVPSSISCNFQNSIEPGSLTSSLLVLNGQNYIFTDYIPEVDMGSGIVYELLQSSSSTISYNKIGTVDYTSGIVNIQQVSFNNIGGGVKIYATPTNQDLYCYNNTIIEIDTISGLTINTVSG